MHLIEILQAVSEADDGSCWSWVCKKPGSGVERRFNWWKEGRGDGDGDRPSASVSQPEREIPYGDETVKYTLGRKSVHAVDRSRVRGERGRGGFKAEDIVEERKGL